MSEVMKTSPVMTITTFVAAIMLILLPILGFGSGEKPGQMAFVIIGSIIMLAVVSYYTFVMLPNSTKSIDELRKMDPLFSQGSFDSRIGYLMKAFYCAMNFDVTSLKPFIDPYIYNEMRQTYRPTGKYILYAQPLFKMSFKGSSVVRHMGRIFINYQREYQLTVFDGSRRIQKVTQLIKYQLCRGENVRTAYKNNMEALVCPGCGMSINLTANGKCKFCGTEQDLSQVDWIFGRIDTSMYN